MNTITRRAFGKRFLAVGALPLIASPRAEAQTSGDERGGAIPAMIAGYTLTQEDKQLAAKFLSTHEKNMVPLRGKDLPNSLPPAFLFSSPIIRGENGEAKK
jgi:hypothetical protein